ncbi:radical SAM protein [Candidatus Phycosocius spiralis]|uniref:Radical SAM core domain-containing protein n=1 Tax=Candidatus Phycosocius spiralis TaxID=2815099 RepID=A0ABQ4PXJ3_9PROT|nr:radical SAM protein [Candidatus Phycosocius spiralis]GIU67684.1 hypothetical protein PsB1_1838 [Candidatus Phycosocius spiralis]
MALYPTQKFQDQDRTAKGEPRARVTFEGFKTLWFNTGTLCNITCVNCYIESSPTNDRLVYLTPADVASYLDELATLKSQPIEIGFTGGEPFLNPDMIEILHLTLERGHFVLLLTNAMKPMMRPRVQRGLTELLALYREKLNFRVSLDHWSPVLHNQERGEGAFEETCLGIDWLAAQGAKLAIAGRNLWGEGQDESQAGFAALIESHQWPIQLDQPFALVLFPELDAHADVPEITPNCWTILGVDPSSLMCASSRMVVKRKGAKNPIVLPCTLLPYEPAFELGRTLTGSQGDTKLNHPHCAKFCVLGGGSCSA